jgi:hypothetical protein
MYFATHNLQIAQEGTVSSADTIIGRQYAAAIGGSAPPTQFLVVHYSVLTKYQEAIKELEDRSRADKMFISELLRTRTLLADSEDSLTGPLNTSASALVDSLLSTVPNASFYSDEVEES